MNFVFSTTKKKFQVHTVNKIWLPAFTKAHLCSQPSQEELEVLPTQHVEDRNKEKEILSLEHSHITVGFLAYLHVTPKIFLKEK
jgi:hypothetical protein